MHTIFPIAPARLICHRMHTLAYLRLNRYQVELVHSKWQDGRARTHILERFRSFMDLERTLASPDRQRALEKKADAPLDTAYLIRRGRELFQRCEANLNGPEGAAPEGTTNSSATNHRMHTTLVSAPLHLPDPLQATPPPAWNSFAEIRRGFSSTEEYAQALIIQSEWQILYGLKVSFIVRNGKTLLRISRPPEQSALCGTLHEFLPILRLGTQITSISLPLGTAEQALSTAEVTLGTAWQYSVSLSELLRITSAGLALQQIGDWYSAVRTWLNGSSRREKIRQAWRMVEEGNMRDDTFFSRLTAENPPQCGAWTRLVWGKAVWSFGPVTRAIHQEHPLPPPPRPEAPPVPSSFPESSSHAPTPPTSTHSATGPSEHPSNPIDRAPSEGRPAKLREGSPEVSQENVWKDRAEKLGVDPKLLNASIRVFQELARCTLRPNAKAGAPEIIAKPEQGGEIRVPVHTLLLLAENFAEIESITLFANPGRRPKDWPQASCTIRTKWKTAISGMDLAALQLEGRDLADLRKYVLRAEQWLKGRKGAQALRLGLHHARQARRSSHKKGYDKARHAILDRLKELDAPNFAELNWIVWQQLTPSAKEVQSIRTRLANRRTP